MNKLHDATLLSAKLVWKTGLLRLVFLPCSSEPQQKVIIAEDTICFNVTRHFPWGKSVSVNKVIHEQGEGIQKVKIEMQSGDVLKIEARSITTEVV